MQEDLNAMPVEPEKRIQEDFLFPPRIEGVVGLVERDRILVAKIRHQGKEWEVQRYVEQEAVSERDGYSLTPEDCIKALALAIEKGNFPRKDLIIALPHSFFSLDILTVPPVGTRNTEAIISRKILSTSSTEGGNVAWCYEILEGKGGDKQKGNKVLIARAPVLLVERIHAALEKHKLKASVITVPLAGMIHLMRAKAGKKQAEEPNVSLIIELSSEGAMLSIFGDETLRQIRPLKGRIATDKDRFNQILHVEVQRSIAFYKEKHKGDSIEKALLLGSRADGLDLDTGPFGTNPLLPLESPYLRCKKTEERNKKNEGMHEGLMALFAGILLTRNSPRGSGQQRKDTGINFKAKPKRVIAVAALLASVVLLFFAGMFLIASNLHKENRDRELLLFRLKNRAAPLEGLVARRDTLGVLEEYQEKLKTVVGGMEQEKREVAETLIRIDGKIPPGTTLQSISYIQTDGLQDNSAGSRKLSYQFEGDFTADGSANLEKFINAVKASGTAQSVSFHTTGAISSASENGEMNERVTVEMVLQ